MEKKSTRLKILFFSLLLAGFIGIQYSWVRSMQRDKLQNFRSRVISGLNGAANKETFATALVEFADTTILGLLKRSFSTNGLARMPFEYGLAVNGSEISSPGFHNKSVDSANNLVLHYVLQRTGQKEATDEVLTVVVPSWKKLALRQMGWVIFASVLMTAMILAIFCSASYFAGRRQQTLYDNRSKAIQDILQQLEAPLATVSVAADALRNARVMHDPGKVNYYQQIITEESRRMNEQVENFLREIKK